ncbi:universal stress protein [Pseudomonas cavernicola]|uniref:Universal stress protein n=1 Tax=Pseudomonas cavernicola TaxID=2320866 RepID=A0A418X9D0_9PSED|nr:universal stress protein [Pseudomonas cavernicola]RJG09099.1 universal stress protein [Pseudomonas cavernicola]
MSQYQRLFLISDPAMRHSAALQRAVALAGISGAALHIAAFVEASGTLGLPGMSEHARENYLQEHQKWLKDEAEQLRAQGINVTTEVASVNNVLQEILLHVTEMQPDLLIKDVQREPALKRAFITPLDSHLLRECPVPVHLVSEVRCPLPRVVVAAVDPSQPEMQTSGLNDRIIEAANGLALQCDAELHLLHAYDQSQTHLADAGAGAVTLPGFASDVRRSLHKSFITLAERYGVPPERQHFILGLPVKVIADFAAHNQADVIVMGSMHRKGLDKLIGSTTEHLLYHVPCSILAIKPQVAGL